MRGSNSNAMGDWSISRQSIASAEVRICLWYETAIVGSEEWRWKKEIEDGKMEQYFQKRIENKLIFFDTVSVETAVVKDEFEVTAGAQKRKMRVSVKRSAALTVPEEKIRRKKVLQEIVERDQEE